MIEYGLLMQRKDMKVFSSRDICLILNVNKKDKLVRKEIIDSG